MNERRFWKIIKGSHSVLARGPEKQQKRLIRILAKKKVQDIVMFDCFFAHFMNLSNTWELRAAASIIGTEFSEPFFSDFRGWLICKGEKTFYKAMKDPEILYKLIKFDDPLDWVGYEACALEAYELKTGTTLPSNSSIKGIKWVDEDLPQKYPKLWRKFGAYREKF